MTPLEYAKLLQYIAENNAWGLKMYELQCERNRRVVKYVDASFDTRTGDIWQITFRSCLKALGNEDKVPGTVNFRIESAADIQTVYDWLNWTGE